MYFSFFFFNDTATTEIYTLSLHDALPICPPPRPTAVRRTVRTPSASTRGVSRGPRAAARDRGPNRKCRSEEHTSELQSRQYLVCRLLLEKKIRTQPTTTTSVSDTAGPPVT